MPTFRRPICLSCRHLIAGDRAPFNCAAFPAGIPAAIVESQYDHRTPYPGDRGIRFEPKPGAPPIPADAFQELQ